ncbi:hypothetical protein [Stenotrophomonas sp.]|uniref:hypothetical protein n=1 Tax=Stenotrophomonas sp. TaxID=69392 RepID=UPI00289C586F|nr:hypothetical protein [Stenotrophomonas sp.]
MRRAVILLPLLLMGGCSCQRHADDDGSAKADATAPAPAPATTDDAQAGALATMAPAVVSAVPPDAADENTVVRNYFNAVMRRDHAAAEALWSGGAAGRDDAALRGLMQLPGVRGIRMESDVPIARDAAQPSRLREVPVTIRVTTADRIVRYKGWYRLQPRADGSGWEIHGASLQPVLD